MTSVLAALTPSYAGLLGSLVADVVWLVLTVIAVLGMWKVFEKAGEPGWGAIVPIYNLYLLCRIAGRPEWWVILPFIPLVNIVWAVIVSLDIARAFGKSDGFGVGLWLLGFIFYPILGFSDARYGASGRGAPAPLAAAYAEATQYGQPATASATASAAPAVGAAWIAPSTPPPWSTRPVAPPPPPGA
jgi:hypothetical protein